MSEAGCREIRHRYTRRKKNHDYYGVGTYHIILKKRKACPVFGHVAGSAAIPPGMPGSAHIVRSLLGGIIQTTIYDFPVFFKPLQIYQYMVMPDHVHILLRVKERANAHLSYYIGELKKRVAEKFNRKCGYPCDGHEEVKGSDIFEENYTDKPIYSCRNLDVWFEYIRHNPHRLAMRMQHPEFFSHMRNLEICGEQMQGYGNLFLLRNPNKRSVVMHSYYDSGQRENLYNNCMDTIESGGVLVSAFISKDEKMIRELAEEKGACVILIKGEPFPERYKPEKHNFDKCSEGRLLILAPKVDWGLERFRHVCQRMNRIAEAMEQGSDGVREN